MEQNLLTTADAEVIAEAELSVENRLEIMDEGVRKQYLVRLSEMPIAPIIDLSPLEEDLIHNVRLYRVTEMVYQKGESVTDKFTTVFNTLSVYNASVFILIDSDGKENRFYIGVRNNEADASPDKRSTVTLGDTLKQTLIGHFPGAKVENEDRKQIGELSRKLEKLSNVASVSVVGNRRNEKTAPDEGFIQGLEKLCLAMSGRPYMGLIIADSQSPQSVQIMRKAYQDLYTSLSPLQKVQITDSISTSSTRSKSFAEMDGKQKAALIGSAAISLAGIGLGVRAALGLKKTLSLSAALCWADKSAVS